MWKKKEEEKEGEVVPRGWFVVLGLAGGKHQRKCKRDEDTGKENSSSGGGGRY